MARPSPINWELVEKAYKNGLNIDDICKNYKLAKKTLQNKIYANKWEVNQGNVNDDINEFKAVLGKVTSHAQDMPEMANIIESKILTVLEDNKLISRNRTLLSSFQALISNGMRSGVYKTAQDIKAGVSSIADIERVANPNISQSAVQVNNANVQENKTIQIMLEE